MISLLKVDLKRILKDRLFLITCIVCVALALLNPLIYKGLAFFIGEDGDDIIGMFTSSKAMFFESFNPANNSGLIASILLGIIVFKDFTHGTIRNKIICGNSRTKIYFSMLISTLIVLWVVILVQALISLGLSLVFFKYQETAFTVKDFGYFMLSVLFEFILYVFISAFISFLCVWVNNAGLYIVCFVGISMALNLFGSLITVYIGLVEYPNKFLIFLSKINMFMSTIIGKGNTYTLSDVLYSVLPPIIYTGILMVLSIIIFRKKDIK